MFLPEHGRAAPPLAALARWQGDGVIARIETEATATAVGALRKTLGIPAIDVSAARLLPAVPDDVAVLGVDDDELLCGLASPPLSSVIPDAVGAGRLAAALLDALMRGDRVGREEWLLPPLGIAARQSTDTLAVDDAVVSAAIRHIRDHACEGVKVAEVARALAITRRVLESRFTRRLGHTPHEEILRVRFRRVEQLLRETDLPLAAIADRCGFRHTEYMTVAFTRRHGLPPSRWRSRERGLPAATAQRTSSSSTRK